MGPEGRAQVLQSRPAPAAVAAEQVVAHGHPRARFDASDGAARLDDLAGDLVTQHHRNLGRRGQAVQKVQPGAADTVITRRKTLNLKQRSTCFTNATPGRGARLTTAPVASASLPVSRSP
jgi:hypothetical protein